MSIKKKKDFDDNPKRSSRIAPYVVGGGAGGASGGGGGMTVGNPVVGGGANRILYTDAAGNLNTSPNLAYVETSGQVVVTPSSLGTGILVQGGASPINGVLNLGSNSGLLEFGLASGVAAFTPLAQPGDGVIRNSSASGGNGNLFIINNNSALGAGLGNITFSTGALGADTAKVVITQPGQLLLSNGNAVAPGLAFIGDTDVGLYRNGAGLVTSIAGQAEFGSFSNGTNLRTTSQLRWAASGGADTAGDVGFARLAAGVIRLTNASTGGGNLVLGTSTVGAIGTGGINVLAIANGTIPSTSPADTVQFVVTDSAAGDANFEVINEQGEFLRLSGILKRVDTQFDKTSDTTLANVNDLSFNVRAGRTYKFKAVLYTTSINTAGVKAAIGGTATATSIIYDGVTTDTGTLAKGRSTALAGTVGALTNTTVGMIVIEGVIVVNAAGTLTVQFAQNVSQGTASSVLVGSTFELCSSR